MKYILFLLLFISCTPQKRLSRLIDKNPELLQPDTIRMIDTIKFQVPSVSFNDTFTIKSIDTIKIEKERLKIEILKMHDTLLIDAECDSITVVQEVIKEVPVIKYKTKSSLPNRLLWIMLVVVVSYALFSKLYNKRH